MKDDNINNIFLEYPDDNSIYLVQKIDNNSGFFSLNKKLLYISKNIEHIKTSSVKTDYLYLQTNAEIQAVNNSSEFESGYYNFIRYDGEYNDDCFISFHRLCILYSENENQISFNDFFYSLISLFQLPSQQNKKNLIGLFGELEFILYIYNTYGKDISSYWHSNTTDKFDFVLPNVKFEIKSTSSNSNEVLIKHDQLFNYNNLYLSVVNLELNNSGKTLSNIIKYFKNNLPFKNNFNFQVNIEKELMRIPKDDADSKRYSVNSIKCYSTSKIKTFKEISDRISNITYKYDFSDMDDDILKPEIFS